MSYIGEVPDIFRIADFQMRDKMKENLSKRPKRIKPMPTIDSNPNIRGPLSVTPEFKEEFYKKKAEEKKKERKEYERDLIKKLAKKAHLQAVLATLDPIKRKDAKMIASINIQLMDIESDIDEIQSESGIDLDDLDRGTKLGRFINMIKTKAKKAIKKIKKFFKKHGEFILEMASIILPGIAAIFMASSLKQSSS